MKHILLLTDFSENAENAIRYALQFLEKEMCAFYVMHVHKLSSFTSDDLMYSSSSNTIYDAIVDGPKQDLEILIKTLRKTYKNKKHNFNSLVDCDNFTDAINQVVKSKNIDLIVLGSNGKTGAKEIIFGSNTLNVIRKVNCITMVIPENHSFNKSSEILLPLDSTDSLHGKALTELQDFIETHQLKLHVLRINPNRNDTDYEFYDQSNLASLNYNYFVVNDVPIHHATNSFIQIKSIALTTIFKHKERFFERFFMGSYTTKISNSLKVPLLVFHND